MKKLYNENYKTLRKEIEDTGRWKELLCLWIGRSNTVKWLYQQKQSTDSIQSPSKFQCHSSQKSENEPWTGK
jgi:hypothetical protein